MTRILHLDTANQFCSVALSDGIKLIGLKETNEKNAHSRVITLFIDEILKTNNLTLKCIDAVAVSIGPGSYTGLRIGVSTAKGLCYALNKPIIAVSTLQAMALGTIQTMKKSETFSKQMFFCPMIDARRMEVYSALYDSNWNEIREIRAEVIDENSYSSELKKQVLVFSGDGAEKCKPVLSHYPNAVFVDNFHPSSKYMISVALEKYKNRQFEDVAYFEPFYLKDFKAGTPKVKGLK